MNTTKSTAGLESGIKADIPKLPPKSQALIYQVQLQEVIDNYPHQPSKERIKVTFDILDDLVHQLGPYSSLMESLIEELRNNVYSQQVTSSTVEPYYEKVPFSVLVSKMNKQREKELKLSQQVMEELQDKLKFREHDLEISFRKNLSLKHKCSLFEKLESNLKAEIEQSNQQLQLQIRTQSEMKSEFARIQDQLERDIQVLQNQNAQSAMIIENLTTPLSKSSNVKAKKDLVEKSRNDLPIDSRGILLYNLAQSNQIEKQFSELLDYILDDFESDVSQVHKKKEIMTEITGGDFESESFKAIELESKEVFKLYQTRMESYLEEFNLLKRHISSLQLQERKNQENTKLITITPTADYTARKYATVVEISKDGDKYEPHPSSIFCIKCGTKTIQCPHIDNDIKVLEIKEKTFLKFSHPNLKIRSELSLTNESGEPYPFNTETEDENPMVSANFYKIWKNYYEVRKGTKPKSNRILPLPKLLVIIDEIYDTRWKVEEEFRDKELESDSQPENLMTGFNKPKTESADAGGLSALVDSDAVVEESSELAPVTNLLDNFVETFYSLFKERYVYENVFLKAIHDILTSLEANEKKSKPVQVLCRHLSGKEEEIWKYVHLTKKLFKVEEATELTMAVYLAKVKIQYPDRSAVQYETMGLEFTSYTKNKISKANLIDYVYHMIVNKLEPNFELLSKSLDKFDVQLNGYLTKKEFCSAMVKILPSAPSKEYIMRYSMAEREFGENKVPLERLTSIAAYTMMNVAYHSGWKTTSQLGPTFSEVRGHLSSP
ncbi:hypothetical protein BC833DRAFT_585568 [Globomyces pollinis-pini]|nr:hypothetical protein BC833DRAFT_585568 [Globomyces pollinis-pini]